MSRRMDVLAEMLRRARTTPGRLWVAGGAIGVAALLFCAAVLWAVAGHRNGMQTVGRDAAPSIIAAQSIKASLADMHSQAANQLLNKPGESPQSAKDFEKRRREATEGILAAAGNITYGDAERLPLRNLLNELGRYEAVIAQAVLLHEQRNPGFLARHRAADAIMQQGLLPAAAALDKANRDALDAEYQAQRRSSYRMLTTVVGSGLLLLAVLGGVQWFLFRRMRRLLNPALLLAAAITLVFLGVTVKALWTEESALKVAKEDAFDSIHALWKARADAYDANGDESRWLLDRSQATAYDKAFQEKSALLARWPESMTPPELLADVQRNRLPAGFQGHLAAELRNITFAGERESAMETLRTYLEYYAIDSRIRQLESQGKHAEAVALCIGDKPGQSNWAFDRFDAALGRTIDVNQKEFERVVAQGFQALAGFEVWAPLTALGVVALAYLGLRPRLREYAA